MKKTMANTMLTTGATLSLLAVFFMVTGKNDIHVTTVFQIAGANIVINFGLLLRSKFEIRNTIFDFIVNLCYIIAVLVVFGFIFNWYDAAPIWLLVVMALIIYVFVIITTMAKIRSDTKEINELLQKRREKDREIAP